MKSLFGPGGDPSPELLAAYFDGEFEGRDDLSLLRQRLEHWLALHPQGQEDLAHYQRLRQMWHDTTPHEPSREQWDALLRQISASLTQVRPPARVFWKAAAGLAAACLLVLVAWSAVRFVNRAPSGQDLASEDEVFPVATESEIVIFRVAGDDAPTVIVGELPLKGPLELMGPGDVTFTSIQPDARDNMMPHVSAGPGSPMVWARLESER
ncbi:MAG: hypothetical protein L0Y72_11200 [Gemmataceae bacterium]|nr:hypothetical protein [Gemmataceae bacterium]MCI0739603.1 hypothetical protein [Gemmataceae bacterium]